MKPLAAAPVIETDRLILRGFEPQDFDAAQAMWCEPAVFRLTTGIAKSKREVWSDILRHVAQWQWLGYGYWAVTEKSSGQFIGQTGFADFRREEEYPITEPEAGWAFATEYHGKGFATEACGAATSWGDVNLRSAKTACIIYSENQASMRLAAKLGFLDAYRYVRKEKQVVIMHRQNAARPIF